MSMMEMHVFSEALNKSTCVNVILPMPRRSALPPEGLRVLTLLHGMGDDYSAWQEEYLAGWSAEQCHAMKYVG